MWRLAWRNLWRQKARSLVTASAVALVVLSTLLFFGLAEAMKNGMFQVLTERAGHLVVTRAGADEAREFDAHLIREAARVEAALREVAGEGELAVLLEVPVLASNGSRSRGIQLVGLRQTPGLERQFAHDYLSAGRLPAPESLDEIVLGESLARALRVDVGEVVYIFAPGTEGLGAGAYTLVGLLDFPEAALEGRTAYVSLAAAQELAAPEAATRFQLHLPDLHRITDEDWLEQVRDRLAQPLGPELHVKTWREAEPGLATLLDLVDPIMLVFNGLGFVLAGLLVVNTVYLSLAERIREFGVIIALGADRWRVMRMVISESLVLVLTGTAVGTVLGLGFIARLAQGFRFPDALTEYTVELGIPAVMYAGLTTGQLVITILFAVGTALAAALWPAWVAGRLQPVEAMRHVT